MSQTKIEELTPEQEALILFYWKKWRANALSTEPIDRQKASEAVEAAYTAIGFQEPSILFCDSPYVAVNLNFKLEQLKEHQRVSKLLCPDKLKRWNPQIAKLISNQVWQQIDEQFFT